LFKRKKEKFDAVKNANFDRVLSVVERYLDESLLRGCTCEHCVNSIIARALNYLPPHYYVNGREEQEAGSPWIMVESAVCDAAEMFQEHSHRSRGRMLPPD
jgi:hypothetical protein